MKVLDPTTDNVDGASCTSYYGVKVKASYAELSRAFGDVEYIAADKVSYEWICMTDDGRTFTIYDWKEGNFSEEKVIEWHIGSLDIYSSMVAKDEVEELLKLTKSKSII